MSHKQMSEKPNLSAFKSDSFSLEWYDEHYIRVTILNGNLPPFEGLISEDNLESIFCAVVGVFDDTTFLTKQELHK